MARTKWPLLVLLSFHSFLNVVYGETYNVKIGSEVVNIVDKNFLSFTLDPKHLFSTVEAISDKECSCMASFLSPAYLRIAGPSTSMMTFQNTTITIDNPEDNNTPSLSRFFNKHKKRQIPKSIEVSEFQWRQFMKWANSTGFDIVFALNNDGKSASGVWDQNTAVHVLSIAKKAKIEKIFWQLGYECTNQSIDEYLNDLESLRSIVESTAEDDVVQGWKVVGADVTRCLREESRSDFKDYLTLSADMMDAVLLNGNTTTHELSRMKDADRLRLLKTLHDSKRPLWLTERPQSSYDEVLRAADWAAGLGHAARNGFSVHFRELVEEELKEPTLSFYMAFLYKNLVGERVLPVDFEAPHTTLFAHCTSLRHKNVPGAVTLYGVNMDDEPARLSLRLSKRETGGEIMQFILNQDREGNIVVNNRVMSNEGDIRPVVKRVRPYKNLIINLPAGSFGFWVLANTNIEACQDFNDAKNKTTKAEENSQDELDKKENKSRNKRFAKVIDFDTDFNDIDKFNPHKIYFSLKDEIEDLNSELKNVNKMFKKKETNKIKRQAYAGNNRKTRRQLFKSNRELPNLNLFEYKPITSLISNFLQMAKNNMTNLANRMTKPLRLSKSRLGNRRYTNKRQTSEENNRHVSRSRRHIVNDKLGKYYDNMESMDKENEIDSEFDNKKLLNVLSGIQNQLHIISDEIPEIISKSEDSEIDDKKTDSDKVILKTEISDDSATLKFTEMPSHAIKTAIENVVLVINDLNENLNRIWTVLSFFSD